MTEHFDVVSADGATKLGVKSRADVHRDGDWHVAFHLWVTGPRGVLLQRRASDKDSWPGRLDATAAGHLVSGERVEDGLREAEEELGIAYDFASLVGLGVHRVDETPRPGFVNREHQHVFAVRDDRPLTDWTAFDRGEVAGLVLVAHESFAALAGGEGGEGERVAATEWDGECARPIAVCAGDLVPSPYLAAIAPALARLA